MSKNPSTFLSSVGRPNAVCRACRSPIPQRHAAPFASSIRLPSSESTPASIQRQNSDEYKPAATWEGLEWIGTEEWLRQKKKKEFLKEAIGLKRSKQFAIASTRALVESEFHHALAEVYICENSGFPLANLKLDSLAREKYMLKAVAQKGEGQDIIKPVILCETEEARELAYNTFWAHNKPAKGSLSGLLKLRSEIPQDSLRSLDQLPIQDSLRFPLLKQLLFRTGRRIPDCEFDRCTTVGSIHRLLVKPRKSPNVAKLIQQNSDINGLANVQTFAQKQTIIDQDTSLGRAKIIRQELERRGLPIFKHKLNPERTLPTEFKAKRHFRIP